MQYGDKLLIKVIGTLCPYHFYFLFILEIYNNSETEKGFPKEKGD